MVNPVKKTEAMASETMQGQEIMPQGVENSKSDQLASLNVSSGEKIALARVLYEMACLLYEIESKVESTLSREKSLDNMFDVLCKKGIFGETEEKQKLFGGGVITYVELLLGVAEEIKTELAAYGITEQKQISADNSGLSLKIHFSEERRQKIGDEAIVRESIVNLRRQSKNIHKYLMVSYSRYMYGFDAQERRLAALMGRVGLK